MEFTNVTTKPCLIESCDSAEDTRCLDLEFAADNPDICDDSSAITGLRVVPVVATVAVGDMAHFQAFLTFANGKEKDVTNKAEWSSNDAGRAMVDESGDALGVAVGICTITASYRQKFAFAQLTVEAQCFQVGMDIVLVFDRSGSMSATSVAGVTRMDEAKSAAKALVENAVFTKDRISVISFSGIWEATRAGTLNRMPNVTEHITLSGVKSDVLAAIDSVILNAGSCIYETAEGLQGTRCATGIGGGLQAAQDELLARGRAGDIKKVVVLMTDGMENICDPDPQTVAAAMAVAGWTVVVIAVAVPDVDANACDGSATTTHTFLASLATCSLFFSVPTADELAGIYARIPSVVCEDGAVGECSYFFPIPTFNPPAAARYRDQLDYDGFINWDVTEGFVDLFGIDLYDLIPGNGLYVDLVGTDQGHPVSESKSAEGTLTSKTAFNLSPGRYRLTVTLGGNHREPRTTDSVVVTCGPLTRTINVTDWQQTFTDHVFDFTVATGEAAPIVISHSALPEGAVQTVGILLGGVTLENLDTGEVLIEDNFDEENPI